MSYFRTFYTALHLECLSLWRDSAQIGQSIWFFIISLLFFPLAVGSTPSVLRDVGPGFIWIMALFASLLPMNSLLTSDEKSGFLAKCTLRPSYLYTYVYIKVIAYWLFNGLPLAIIACLLSGCYYLPVSLWPVLWVSLSLGTFILSLFILFVTTLTLTGRQPMLTAFIIMPLVCPVLIIGSLMNYHVLQHHSPLGYLYLLIALFMVTILGFPLASTYLLRMGQR